MTGIRSAARWLLRGEANVSATLDSLSVEIREVQHRLDALVESSAARDEDVAALGRRLDRLTEDAQSRAAADAWPTADPLRTDGVNVVGYLQRQLGIGAVARRIVEILRSADAPTSAIAFGATSSRPISESFALDQRIDFTASLAVVAADQLGLLEQHHPELRATSERLAGYCFWELDRITDDMRAGCELVDEVWTATRFTHDAFADADVPVRLVPITIPEPVSSGRERSEFAPLSGAGDRPVVGLTFDHFSVLDRKNPLGAIEAFRRAFTPDEGPLLVVKTMNGHVAADAHDRLVAAAAERPDVVVWDRHLSSPDQAAFIAGLDLLVSLHRSEGLGLHLAEAMWLGTPVIATGYSGNVDFMDRSCAALVGHELVEIGASEGGGIYPPGARWADPDLDEAADHLRRLIDDSTARSELARAARSRMESQPDDATTARSILDAFG
ncbi:MAG: glycosyltransferase [Actinomycetota bacterium]